MVKGQRVVCIDATFGPEVKLLYQKLPVKDAVYTIREVYLGRSRAFCKVGGMSDGEVGVLLEELINPLDPRVKTEPRPELGFKADRFAPLQESEEELAEELVHAEGELIPA